MSLQYRNIQAQISYLVIAKGYYIEFELGEDLIVLQATKKNDLHTMMISIVDAYLDKQRVLQEI